MASILPPAGELQKNAMQKSALQAHIIEILKRLRDELRTARQVGLHELTTTIPIQFEVPNMKNSSCQRIIWASIISAFEEQGYRVRINPQKKKCVLKVRWMSKEDEKTVADQIKLIAARSDQSLDM